MNFKEKQKAEEERKRKRKDEYFSKFEKKKYSPVQLKPTDGLKYKRDVPAPRFATIDIETQDWVNYVCGEVYWLDKQGNEHHFETNKIDELLIQCFRIVAKHRIRNFVAHYGGKFDFLFFMGFFIPHPSFQVENIIPRGSSILSFDVTMRPSKHLENLDFNIPSGKITFRDSSGLLPFSLGSLTKSFNVETLKGEMDFLFVEDVYNERPYVHKILEDKRCVLFYKGRQIFSLTKDMTRGTRISNLRYWNTERFHIHRFRGKVSKVKPYKYDKNFMQKITFPIYGKQDLLTYLHHDCKSLYQCIDKFFNSPLIRFSKRKWTTASQSVEVFRMFLKKPLHSIPDDHWAYIEGDVDHFVRLAYFGGRTEIFKPVFDHEVLGKDFLSCYDVNSLYPFSMSKNPFPDRFLGWYSGKEAYDQFEMGVWRCKVRVPKNLYIPPLPIKFNERLIFPVGEFEGYWTKFELEYAKSLGCEILEYHTGAIFENAGYIFKEFIDTLYNMRLEAKEKKDNVTQMTMKLLMNSCYGRMGINKNRSKIIIDEGLFSNVRYVADIDTKFGTIRLSELEQKSSDLFSNPVIACYVTSYARVHLHKQMNSVGEKSVYYCDSVTKDRMVLIEEEGFLKVVKIESVWDKASTKGFIEKEGEKEVIINPAIKTLSWCPEKRILELKTVKKIIRHKTSKKIYEVYSNKGRTRITEDHSLIDEYNNRKRHEDIDTLFSPKINLEELKIKEIDFVDMHEILRHEDMIDFSRENSKACSVYNPDDQWLKFSFENSERDTVPMIKRKWTSSDLLKFMRFCAFFIGDGSISTPHSTNSRYMWSINSEKLSELEDFKDFMLSVTKNVSFNIIKSSKTDNTYKLSSGCKLMAYFMKSLIGQRAEGKKLPDFIFNLPREHKEAFIQGLLIGDGSKINDPKFSLEYRSKNFTYCTKSETLVNQLSVLFSMTGRCHSISYRESKGAYTIVTSEKNRDKKPYYKEIAYEDYVYDLSVEGNENFFDCMGLIGLHNTDSVFTDRQMKTGKELGAMKLEYKCRSACFLLPKTYVNEDIIDEDGKEKAQKLTMKGFDYKNVHNAFTYMDFLDYLNGERDKIFSSEKPRFATFKLALKQGKFVTMKNDPVLNRQNDERREQEYFKKTGKKKKFVKEEYKLAVKKLLGYYTKREIIKNGFDTVPLKVDFNLEVTDG